MRRKVMVLVMAGLLLTTINAHAFIVINEVLADPPAGLVGDADGNGTRSSSGDEFVELLNFSADPVDLNGWSIHDGTSLRHLFSAPSKIDPYHYVVVFGSNASTGGLSLNNSGDTVQLFDNSNALIDEVVYNADLGNQNQSFTRFPEGDGDFTLHSEISGDVFSPETTVEGRLALLTAGADNPPSSAVPEPASLVLLGSGLIGMLVRRK